MSNRLQPIKEAKILQVFEQAAIQTDSMLQRIQIGEGLRQAAIYQIDGTQLLFVALQAKYAPTLTKPIAQKNINHSTFTCPKCKKDYGSQNRLNAHRPKKCQA